jgi:hypothetical protein
MKCTRLQRMFFCAAAGLLAWPAFCADSTGKVTEVRVYRGQALVTRSVQFQAQAGAQEVTVANLPDRVVPESLYAVGGGDVVIRAVRFRATAVEEEPREEVRKLDEQIKDAEAEGRRIASELAGVEHRGKYLDGLENFVAPTAQVEMTKGVLNPQAVIGISEFIFTQRNELAAKKLALENEQADGTRALEVLERQRGELKAGATKTRREAIVFLEAPRAGAAEFSLNYLVDNVGWSPAYTARLNDEHTRLTLEYQAVVTQMSGEEWPDVQLLLSTSHPLMAADSPALSPLVIQLTRTEQQAGQAAPGAKDFAAKRRELSEQIRNTKQTVQAQQQARQKQEGPVEDSFASNRFAAHLQNLELAASDDVVKTAKRTESGGEGMAVEYPLTGRVSLQSREDQQMFRIATLELNAEFYYTAVPLLTDYVYQGVEAVNTSEYPLLPGPYTAYVRGAFAGRGNLPLVARGQGLNLGFGTETQLRAARDLEEKTTDVRGGNKVVKYGYKIRLQNYMAKAVKVRVWDRMPQASDSQVAVTLLAPGAPLSEDALYKSLEQPRGLLRWDVEVPAGASGAKAYGHAYQFQLEFDRNLTIGELPAAAVEKMQAEFEVLQEMRAAKQ